MSEELKKLDEQLNNIKISKFDFSNIKINISDLNPRSLNRKNTVFSRTPTIVELKKARSSSKGIFNLNNNFKSNRTILPKIELNNSVKKESPLIKPIIKNVNKK